MQNRIPPEFDPFVADQVQTLLARGCIAPWADVKTESAPARPRMVMPLGVEPTKPRMIYDARALNRLPSTCLSRWIRSVGWRTSHRQAVS